MVFLSHIFKRVSLCTRSPRGVSMLITPGVQEELEQLISDFAPSSRIVSRPTIEQFVQEHQERYPTIAGHSPSYMRKLITFAFNAVYPQWAPEDRHATHRTPRQSRWIIEPEVTDAARS